MDELLYRIAELERRLNNIVRVATVDMQSGDRVRVVDGSGLKTGMLPWLTRRAGNDRDWWAPESGEQVVLLCPSGDPALGVVLPSIYRASHPAPAEAATVHRIVYQDGAVTEYDRAAHKLEATIPGDIEATATGTITATAGNRIQGTAPDIIFTGAVQVNGTIHASNDITSDTAIGAPNITGNGIVGTGSISAPSILADGDEVAHHDHECPQGGRTSELGA